MDDNLPMPGRTLAILLGASRFRHLDVEAEGTSFYNSSNDFYEYLLHALNIPKANLASFFDDGQSPDEQLNEVREFVRRWTEKLREQGTPARDIIVHYVGHGILSQNQVLSLAVRNTEQENNSIKAPDLAIQLREVALVLRKYIIVDCCFSGGAYRYFDFLETQQLVRGLPTRGTSVLSSTSSGSLSYAPNKLKRTIFSDALLKVLNEGHKDRASPLSLNDVTELTQALIAKGPADGKSFPEVHSPNMPEGDVAKVPLFPNLKGVGSPVSFNDDKVTRPEREAAGLSQLPMPKAVESSKPPTSLRVLTTPSEVSSATADDSSQYLNLFSFSDIRLLRLQAYEKVDALLNRLAPERFKVFEWDLSAFDHSANGINLPRCAAPGCAGAIVLCGEQIGDALPEQYTSAISNLDAWMNGPNRLVTQWPERIDDQARLLDDGCFPLTATVFTTMEALSMGIPVRIFYLADRPIDAGGDVQFNGGQWREENLKRRGRVHGQMWLANEYSIQAEGLYNFLLALQRTPFLACYQTQQDALEGVQYFVRTSIVSQP